MALDETTFLTGFPGFIAGRLLERLAKEEAQFLLLVQPHLLERAQTDLDQIAAHTGKPLTQFRLLKGDITQENFGLGPPDLDLARSQTTSIFHLAAIYDLAVARDTAMKVNVGGTRNVNNFARSLPGLCRYHYVSTCYVAGKRQGRILETELRHEQGFRNFYEESKYLAELEVDALKSELPLTIHRPSVVCGDSKTGETQKYDGVYYLIHYLRRWPALLRLFNIGNRRVRLNLAPVDFVVDAMATLAKEPLAIGKTVQIADPNSLTTHELFNEIARCLKTRGSRITIPERMVNFTLMSPPSPRITGLPHRAVPYFFLNQTYDTTQALKLLESHGVHCPPFPSYVKNIIEFAVQNPVL